jgi:signal transduction histidine kinase/ligand-binding sensor domain-containing protein
MRIGAAGRLARFLTLAFMLCLCSAHSLALDPALDASQYGHTTWKIREGFSKTRITAFAQTPDGYLWLGTPFGLQRFDGVRNVPWEPPSGASLPNRRIRALLVARDGTLWIGTDAGVASWREGKFATYPRLDGKFVTGLVEDREGKVWVGAVSVPGNGSLCTIAQGRTECHGEDGLFQGLSVALYLDTSGALWVGSGEALWRWAPGSPVRHALRDPVLISRHALSEGPAGELLVLTNGGIRKLVGGRVETFVVPNMRGPIEPSIVMRDRDGALWIGTVGDGVVHVHQGRAETFGRAQGLSGEFVNTVFEDRKGNLWVATLEGIDRFRPISATTYSLQQGLTIPVYSVVPGHDASVWINTRTGLSQGSSAGIRGVVSWGSITADSGGGRSLFQDRNGRVWMGAEPGFGYLDGSHFVKVRAVPAGLVDAITEDDRGNLWLAHRSAGIFRLSPDLEVQPIPWTNPNRTGRGLFWRMAADPAQGGVWIGLSRGVVHFVDGSVRASHDLTDALARPRVNDLSVATDGTLWIASDGGLVRLKGGHLSVLDRASGLPCDDVDSTAVDDDGALWLFTPCGIGSIPAAELTAWAASIERGHARHQVRATILDGSEGTRYSATPRPYGPHIAKARDGKLWFATIDGATVIDPRRLTREQLAPSVHVERIVADHKAYDSPARVRLLPLVRELQIDYTATSFTVPEKAIFRYKLEGYDRDWKEAGNRRQAFYSELNPGDYRFRVVASTGGPWSEEGAVLDFSIPPAYWQTWSFRTLCVAASLALLWALYLRRVRQLRRQFNMALEARVAERTRIARALHDTLLQSFHGLLLRFQTVRELFANRPADAMKLLEDTIDQAAEAITEGRDAVQGLRAATDTTDLAAAIRTVGEEIAAENDGHEILRVEVQGAPRSLHPILRDEIFRIAGEALRNAFGHAEAKQIEVELHYGERHLGLRVRDDGKGIDPAVLSEGGREGHFGMHGMRERATLIGGKLTVWSALGSGTEVELNVPASHAYTASAPETFQEGTPS